jgi:purine-cytosine permease-like protein
MNILDLAKATVVCGSVAFLVYSFPVVVQIVIIGVLSLLWLAYAYRTWETLRRRWFACLDHCGVLDVTKLAERQLERRRGPL